MKTLFSIISLSLFSIGFSQIQFANVAQTSGLNNTEFGFGTLGGGISFYDFNQDGLDDITMSTANTQNVRFFENNANGFTEVFMNGINAPYENKSVIWVDYDNDGDLDFYVTNYLVSNHLYQNDGNYNFTEVSQSAGLTKSFLKSWGASWADYDRDGDLDLFILHRDGLNQLEPNILYKNNGDGTFTDVSSVAGLSLQNHMSFCAAFFDYNNDGWLDLYIANDKTPTNLLYKNNADGTFTDISALSQSNIDMDAMSTTIGDYNKDGFFDIYITNTSSGNVFLNNNADGTFTDIAPLTNTTFNSVGWGAVFLDADLDTDLDIYVSGSMDGSQGMPSAAFYEQINPSLFNELPDSSMPNDNAISFSNAIGDFNNDGKPDIVVLNFSPNDLFLWENSSEDNNKWVKIKLKGSVSNSMAIGAVIELKPENMPTQYELVMCSEGYIAQNSAYEFFGLGNAQNIENVTIKWPNGLVETYQNLQVNTAYTIEEGNGILNTERFNLNQPKVFPNPTNSLLNIHAKDIIREIKIYTLQGKLLLKKVFNKNEISLDVQYFSEGIYLLEIQNDRHVFKQKLAFKN